MGIMSGTNGVPSKSAKKYVLQQSNCNLDVRDEDPKSGDKGAFPSRSKDDILETENQCSPQKSIKFEAKKLRTIRLDLSSLKRGIVADFSSDDSSEDEAKKKPKPRPVVPNYVTNTDCGPCRKPRQSRQDPFLLSSQNSPKSAKVQPLSIARRNARERNRVKQVNEGFATLRGRIPEYISEAYNEEKGRKSAKKLSKVETLRMAVDYIRHLEGLLDLKSTEDSWLTHVKTENPPWDTPTSSTEYPSPRCQAASADSPGTSYDQTFEYQDRIFYEYGLDFVPRKESSTGEKRPAAAFGILTFGVNENENQCVEDFKYYETFNRLKKKNGEEVEENAVEEEEEERKDLKISNRHSKVHFKDAIKEVSKKTVLPSITESFSKGIPVFF